MRGKLLAVCLLGLFLLLSSCANQAPAASPPPTVPPSPPPSLTPTAPAPASVPAITPTPAQATAQTAMPFPAFTPAPDDGVYSYTIQTTVDQTYDFAKNCTIHFAFSRPVFTGSSPLAADANAAFEQAEADYNSRMQGLIPNNADYADAGPSDEDWFFTETTDCTYEKSEIVSFTLHMEWWMGGVHNSSDTGFTFDFSQGKQLKIADVLIGDDEQITQALVDAFYNDTGGFVDSDNMKSIVGQSGPDANFYLADDGVHIAYMPYVIPATQDGVDILLPWSRLDLVRCFNG